MSVETLCPKCSHGPIADGADECPRCHYRFAEDPRWGRARRAAGIGVRKDESHLEATRTTLGGITGAVEAHPAPTATVLVASTFAWLVRCLGVLGDRPQPAWPLGLAAVNVAVGVMLLLTKGPARSLAQMVGLAQLATGYLAGGGPVTQLGYAGVGAALFVMTVGEPSDARRWLGTGAAVAMLGFGLWGVATGQ